MRMATKIDLEKRRALAERSQKEAEQLTERSLYCPCCGYKVGIVYSDSAGHIKAKCQKCKAISVLNLAYFRRQRRRWNLWRIATKN